tara:strand:- start:532 stop:1038 length:507 start_codon:yes stop_codon:yes gene_type:complete
MVVWITGLSGAGKTTIANYIIKKYLKIFPNILAVDGDVIRDLFGNDLGFNEKDRVKQIKRLQKLAHFLEKQNQIVVVSALYCNPEILNWNRENFINYYEIYLKAPIEVVRTRDPKGIYKRYDLEKEINVVGLDIPWNEPKNSDLIIDIDKNTTVKTITDKVIESIEFK